MNKLNNFMTKRKNDKRNSLIIDNFDYNDNNDNDKNNDVKRNVTILKRQVSLDLNEYKIDKIDKKTNMDYQNERKYSIYTNESVDSIVNKGIQKFDLSIQQDHLKQVKVLDCYKCKNTDNKDDKFMILNCSHIYHIGCLVESHFDKFNKFGGIIDQDFCNNCICEKCNEPMELEDIIHIHNKFTKTTKEHLKIQEDRIEILDKQMNKIKEEMRNLLEYKQRLEDKKNKSKQITISLNNRL